MMAMCVSVKTPGFSCTGWLVSNACQGTKSQAMSAYQVEAGSATQIFHDDPELVPAEKRAFILGDVRARTGAENRNLGLDILNVIVAGFKINLRA